MTIRPEAEQLAAHVADLRHQIEEAAYHYYVKDSPVLSDAEYDQFMIELQRIEAGAPGTAIAGLAHPACRGRRRWPCTGRATTPASSANVEPGKRPQ